MQYHVTHARVPDSWRPAWYDPVKSRLPLCATLINADYRDVDIVSEYDFFAGFVTNYGDE